MLPSISNIPLTGAEMISVGCTVANFFNKFDTPIKCTIGLVSTVAIVGFSYFSGSISDRVFTAQPLVYEGGESQMNKATNAVVELKDGIIIPFQSNGEISVDVSSLKIKSITFS